MSTMRDTNSESSVVSNNDSKPCKKSECMHNRTKKWPTTFLGLRMLSTSGYSPLQFRTRGIPRCLCVNGLGQIWCRRHAQIQCSDCLGNFMMCLVDHAFHSSGEVGKASPTSTTGNVNVRSRRLFNAMYSNPSPSNGRISSNGSFCDTSTCCSRNVIVYF